MGDSRPGDRRIVVLDILRGICFVAMTVDHSPGDPLFRFSNAYFGVVGFFTAALGFVFLSGLVAGIVYDNHRVRYGSRATVGRIFRRLRGLYLTQLLLCLALLAAVTLHLHGAGGWQLDLFRSAPWTGVLYSVALLYEPGYLGILPMYCLFLAATPLLLYQFEKRRAKYVLASSFALWIGTALVLRLPADPRGIDFGYFNPLAYQLLFVVGLAFGAGQLRVEWITRGVRRALIVSSAIITGTFFVFRETYAVDGPLSAWIHRWDEPFNAAQLGPLRLLNFAAFAVLLYALCVKVDWSAIRLAGVRWLAFVGRHSLPVFAWSILATYTALALLPRHPGVTVGALTAVAMTASLTIPALMRAIVVRRRHADARAEPRLTLPRGSVTLDSVS